MNNAAREIAQKFLGARREARALPTYPGDMPGDLAGAYRIQEQAIGLLGEEIVGWKIGRIMPNLHETLKAERLAGPVFKRLLWTARANEEVPFPVYENGFAAVESEFVFCLSSDATIGKMDWSRDEAAALVGAMHIGVESAGSPLKPINDLGPIAVVSDFGNNNGLILGPEVPNWQSLKDEDLRCETFIDGKSVGRGGAPLVPEGPVGALVWLLEHLAQRGRQLKAGQWVSTGAATGIHDIAIGQKARASFEAFGEIRCAAVKAVAVETARTATAEPR